LAESQLADAASQKEEWNKYFKSGTKMMPRPDAEKEVKESNNKLMRNIEELKRLEFGTPETLQQFTEAAAGTGDRSNYLITLRTQIANKQNQLGIIVPSNLGIEDQAADDPVALNLMRLALVDRFMLACKEAAVPRITRIKHEQPKLVRASDDDEEDTAADDSRGRSRDKEEAGEKVRPDRLVRFPMRVTVAAPERSFAQLLFELQKPAEKLRGYFCLQGFSLWVKDPNSGMVEATLEAAALLPSRYVEKSGIKLKTEKERRGPVRRDYNTDRP
jgi:hypothetical protein